MLVRIKIKDFEILNDSSLIWTCVEPTILKIRGKNFVVKSEAYSQLNTGQRALLMFQILYGHTSTGVEEFYAHQSYLLSNKKVWSQMKNGMQYFEDSDMLKILEQMDNLFQRLETEAFNENREQQNASIADLDRKVELSESINLINKSLREILPFTIIRVATYIRNHTDEFVEFID
jgi:hypothetical protein